MSTTDYRCPRCKSENIQSYVMVYQTGITQNSSTTIAESSGEFQGEGTTSDKEISLNRQGIGIGGSWGNSSFSGTVNTTTNSTTSGRSISHLASTCAPPTPPSKEKYHTDIYLPGGCLGCLGTTVIFILSLPTVIVPILILVLYIKRMFFSDKAKKFDENEKNKEDMVKRENEYLEKQYQKKLDEWKHSYLCMKCGNRFVLRENEE